MKKQRKRKRIGLTRRFGPLPLIFVVFAAASLAIGAATVVSRQLGGMKKNDQERQLAAKPARQYVAVKVAGQNVQVDGQTGQIKPLTAQEAQQVAEGLKGMINQSTEGLTAVQHADGSVSVNLQDRFQNVAVAKKNVDGTVSQSCVNNRQSAAAFFEIDPKLLDDGTKGNQVTTGANAATKQQPNRPASTKNQEQ